MLDRINKRVIEIICEVTPIKDVSVEPDSRLLEDLSFDSVTLLELVVVLESEFDLLLTNPTETASISTVRHLQEYIVEQCRSNR